jgi:pyrimidine-nucleoside phosphorylase
MMPQWIIEKKRDGAALGRDEIRFFIDGYTAGTIPDYQMAALAMAIYFRGMSFDEVAILTDIMMRSGSVVDTSSIRLPKVDKHSTGGIGDKVSLLLAPLVACCGVAVPMISGRGLGITGGTLDKLESIPGYRTQLNTAEFLAVLDHCGCAIIGQTVHIAPADRKLYALRDVTGTVPSIPLISASIMSKKLAEGADALVLDVKWGRGAFMKSVAEARDLARTMVEIGRRMGKGMTALITDMNQPLGRCAGNALEILETVEALRGGGSPDLTEITLELGAHMLLLARAAPTVDAGRELLRRHWDSGEALENFLRMVRAQGGDARAVEEGRLAKAQHIKPVAAPCDGFVARADAEGIGKACLLLGAGRRKVEDRVDPAVGASGILKIGTHVAAGEPLLFLHANDPSLLREAEQLAADSFLLETAPPPAPRLILETLA